MIRKVLLLTLLFLIVIPFTSQANDTTQASESLNKYLKKEHHYYKDGSVKLSSTKVFNAEVTENGKTENRNIMAIFAKYKDVRDSIFNFNVSATYFYDMDNQKILDPSATIESKEASKFSDHYLAQNGNSLSIPSLILLMLALFIGLFVIPILSVKLYKHA